MLLEEWAKQASLEQELDLPVSVIASADAALQAKGQIGFIDLFTQPLFEAVSDILPGKPFSSTGTSVCITSTDGPELQGYADSCAENRSLWQSRLEEFSSQPDHQRAIVQPAIEAASTDDRFRSLFPLLLPPSLLDPSTSDIGTSSTTESPLTPPSSLPSYPTSTSTTAEFTDASTKAMRAVYYTDLLEHKHRGANTGGIGVVPIPGVGGFDWDFERRMSTPNGV